ncbi:hypothetical protein BOTCAL_0336g00010 [Botryotinia calthae]|uniref:Uncharacterized protein n=1 Tax=Botryotinia calthae TaxID=38488 RepID=A0A4Y8CT26_9HELO|nr:hypothetical protein BOTCAL_0336g00010 [Botryotinia calthae]
MQYQVVALKLGKKRKKREKGRNMCEKGPFRENTIQRARGVERMKKHQATSDERRAATPAPILAQETNLIGLKI